MQTSERINEEQSSPRRSKSTRRLHPESTILIEASDAAQSEQPKDRSLGAWRALPAGAADAGRRISKEDSAPEADDNGVEDMNDGAPVRRQPSLHS